jgi:hypothetical protein
LGYRVLLSERGRLHQIYPRYLRPDTDLSMSRRPHDG